MHMACNPEPSAILTVLHLPSQLLAPLLGRRARLWCSQPWPTRARAGLWLVWI